MSNKDQSNALLTNALVADARQPRGGSSRAAANGLSLRPLAEDLETWQKLLSACPNATLYHSKRWIELLSRSHRFTMWLATLARQGRPVAGCVFARAHNPFVRRLISLPFSDGCAMAVLEPEASTELLDALVARGPIGTSYEVRGVDCGAPWDTVRYFANWRLELDRPVESIERGLKVNFRRNLRQAARQSMRIEHGSSGQHLKRFYALQLETRRRFGLPAQPMRFFKLTREIFAPSGDFDIWIANDGGKDVAAAVFLRENDVVYFKWSARRSDCRSSANHLLVWSAIEEFAPRTRALDLGRADSRNQGLTRFKRELGATATPLPHAFYPTARHQVSAEVLTGAHKTAARVWSMLPLFVTRPLGWAIYRFLA